MSVIQINKQLQLKNSFYTYEVSDFIKVDDGIFEFKDIVNGLTVNNELEKSFCYTYDDKNWSNWLRINNLNQIDLTKKFKIKFQWKVIQNFLNEIITIRSFEIKTEQKIVYPKFEINKALPFFNLIKENNVQGISTEISNFQIDMNSWFNGYGGIDCYYWNLKPKIESTDVVLWEQSLHKDTGKKCIKLVVENNLIPQDKVEFNEWGNEWEEFEVKVNKKYFESIFGLNVRPRKDDFIYFCKINRMYYVDSTYLETGIDGIGLNHVLKLKTYQINSSVEHNEETLEFLEEKTSSFEKYYEDDLKEQMNNMTNVVQNNPKTISDDETREEIDKMAVIVDEEVKNHSSQMILNYYDFKDITEEKIAISYTPTVSLTNTNSISFTSWFRILSNEINEEFNIIENIRISPEVIQIKIDKSIKKLKIIENNFIGLNGVFYLISDTVDDDKINIFSSVNITITVAKKLNRINLFRVLDNNNDMSLDILENNLIYFTYNGLKFQENYNFEINKWNNLVLNISNQFKFLGMYVWNLNTTSSNGTDLTNVLNKERKLTSPIILTDSKYVISGSKINISNIRVFKRSMDFTTQSQILGTRIIKKPDIAFIIDDCQVIHNNRKVVKTKLKENKQKLKTPL